MHINFFSINQLLPAVSIGQSRERRHLPAVRWAKPPGTAAAAVDDMDQVDYVDQGLLCAPWSMQSTPSMLSIGLPACRPCGLQQRTCRVGQSHQGRRQPPWTTWTKWTTWTRGCCVPPGPCSPYRPCCPLGYPHVVRVAYSSEPVGLGKATRDGGGRRGRHGPSGLRGPGVAVCPPVHAVHTVHVVHWVTRMSSVWPTAPVCPIPIPWGLSPSKDAVRRRIDTRSPCGT